MRLYCCMRYKSTRKFVREMVNWHSAVDGRLEVVSTSRNFNRRAREVL